MKIAFYSLRDFDELPMCEEFSQKYGIEFVWTKDAIGPDNLDLAKDCIAVSTTPCEFKEEYADIFNSYGVKYVLCRSIGYDHLPKEKLKCLGMRMTNSTYPTECVANYAIMLILMLTRNMNQIMLRQVVQDYSLKGKMGHEIGDMTIGVMGTGNIGRTLIKHLSSFGCKLLAYDIYENEEVKKYAEYVSLDELYAKSDVITLHMPSTADNHHIICEESLSKMKDGVMIVNTARGALINSFDLIKALREGKVSGAALDVIEKENDLYYYDRTGDAIDNDELAILRSFPNVIVSPHTAFYVRSTVANMVEKSFLSVKYFTEGIDNPNEVNK